MSTEVHRVNNSSFFKDNVLLLSLAAVKLLMHLWSNAFGNYGYFRDELYYIACSNHIDIGYVDQPPLSIYILAVSRLFFGDSVFALRLLPAVAGAATVYLTGLMARELGGGKTAQVFACVASIVSLIYLGMETIYSMNAFDILLWALAAYVLIRLLKTEDSRYWLVLGVVLGLGLMNKIGVLWLAAGIFAAFLLTPNRQWFTTRWPWIAASIAFAIFLPYIVWNAMHGWPHIEFIRNATGRKYASVGMTDFVLGQFLLPNPFNLPIWILGLWYFLFSKEAKDFRILGYVFAVSFLILLLNRHSKPEYLSPAYSMLFAGGAVSLERWLAGKAFAWLKPVYLGLLILSGIVLAPAALPILPVETYIRYSETLGIKPSTAEALRLGRLPQFYADMFGWENMAATVASVYQSLSPEEQRQCAIYGNNYGEAGAIDFFAKKYHLPKAISGHNSYWLWGTRGHSGEVVIIIGGNVEDHRRNFEEVEQRATVVSDFAIPYENNLPIFVCRKLKIPLREAWALTKNYI